MSDTLLACARTRRRNRKRTSVRTVREILQMNGRRPKPKRKRDAIEREDPGAHHETAIREDEPVYLQQQLPLLLRLWDLSPQDMAHAAPGSLRGHPQCVCVLSEPSEPPSQDPDGVEGLRVGSWREQRRSGESSESPIGHPVHPVAEAAAMCACACPV